MKKFTKNKGFTIVELIVVMAIIAILILIAVPTFTRYIEDANRTSEAGTGNTIYKSAIAATVDAEASRDLVPFADFIDEINAGVSNIDNIQVVTYVPAVDGAPDPAEAALATLPDNIWAVAVPGTLTGANIDVNAEEDIWIQAPLDNGVNHLYQNGILVEE